MPLRRACSTVILLASLGLAANVVAQDEPSTIGPFVYDDKRQAIVATAKDGTILWTRTNGQLGIKGNCELQVDGQRVYVLNGDVIIALDARTGEPLWRLAEAARSVLVSGKLLLFLPRTGRDKPQMLVGRSTADAHEVFCTELPAAIFSWDSITDSNGIYIVSDVFSDNVVVVDQSGKMLHHFESAILDCKRVGVSRVFVTGKEVICLAPTGDVIWSTKFNQVMGTPGGETIELPDKTVIAYVYGQIYDSGVSLIRFDPSSGKVLWHATCEPLGVGHSKYSHKATVTIQNSILKVDSVGDSGEFVETLDLETGKQLLRKASK